jgi:hypothetical protein
MEKHSGHEDLCGSGHRSIIPYVYGRVCCIAVCVCCSSRELNLLKESKRSCLKSVVILSLYSIGSVSYMQTRGQTGGPGVVGALLQ